MATFNISGCCTMRDIFGFKENCEHEVLHFLQFSSPVTWFDFLTKPQQKVGIDDLSDLTVDGELKNNFSKRCVLTDYNRNVLDYYKLKSDYWIFDFAEMVKYGLIRQTTEKGAIHYFTATGRISKKNRNNQCFLDILSGSKEKIDSFEFLTNEEIEKVISDLKNWVINEKQYDISQIILVRTLNAIEYYDGTSLKEYPNIVRLKIENQYMNKIYDTFEKYFSGCHVIKLPTNIYGVIPHKWGLHSLHFCKEVYDYLYEVIDEVVEINKVSDNEGIELKTCLNLYHAYEKILESNRFCFKLEYKFQRICIDNQKKSNIIASVEKGISLMNTAIKETQIPYLKLDVHFAKKGWVSVQGVTISDYNNDKQIEAFRLSVIEDENFGGSIYYQAKVDNRKEWTHIYSNGQMVGTTGKSMPLTGIKIWLDDLSAQEYSIFYEIQTKRGEQLIESNGASIELDNGNVIVNLKVWMKYRT